MTIGFIYKISSPSTDSVYIGSTTKTIKQRLKKHKNDYKAYLNNKYHYVTSFEIVKYDDCIIELLEQFDFEDKNELFGREGYYVKLDKKAINKVIPNRTPKEYRFDNKEHINEKYKQYYDANKEQIKHYQLDNKEQIKEYKNEKHNCNCGSSYTNHDKARHLRTKKHQQYITNNIQNQTIININFN
jgi:hypothetical protein